MDANLLTPFTVYRESDGRIMRSGYVPHEAVPYQAQEGEVAYAGEAIDDELFYMPGGVKTPRPTLDIQTEFAVSADGEDAVSFSLPEGSLIWCRTTSDTWDDQSDFYFTTEVPGTWVYRIYPFPFQDMEVVIHAA